MKKIAFICGGNSVESEISCLTSLKICQSLKNNNIPFLLIYLDNQNNYYLVNTLNSHFVENHDYKRGIFIKDKKKNAFKIGLKKYYFDYIVVLGHGKNVEDGKVACYFHQLGYPVLSESILNSSLIQDKHYLKEILKANKIKVVPYKILYRYQEKNLNLINNYLNQLKSPVIVKPSSLGSSIGVSLAHSKDELKKSLLEAFTYDSKVVIEKYLKNKIELNIAILGYENDIDVSSIEEVNHNDNILSFYDKYDYSSNNEKRVINPKIDEKLSDDIIKTSTKIFKLLNICGLVRFDYIYDIDNKILYLNEINLIPGSLAYYLFKDKYEIYSLVEKYVNLLEKKYLEEIKLTNKFQEGFIQKIDIENMKK